jgi:hypothetical protein
VVLTRTFQACGEAAEKWRLSAAEVAFGKTASSCAVFLSITQLPNYSITKFIIDGPRPPYP